VFCITYHLDDDTSGFAMRKRHSTMAEHTGIRRLSLVATTQCLGERIVFGAICLEYPQKAIWSFDNSAGHQCRDNHCGANWSWPCRPEKCWELNWRIFVWVDVIDDDSRLANVA